MYINRGSKIIIYKYMDQNLSHAFKQHRHKSIQYNKARHMSKSYKI